ncbi:MAG: aminopeptidase P N-terminal domain-containing protein [Bacteroidota bacterium]
MRYQPLSSNFYINNRERLNKYLKKSKSLVIIQSNDEMPRNGDRNYMFRQSSDLFYLTGLDQAETILCICPEHPNKNYREIVFTKRTDEITEIWNGSKYSKKEVQNLSGIKTVFWTDEFETVLLDLMLNSEHIFLQSNEQAKYKTPVETKQQRFANWIKKEYPTHKYGRVTPYIYELRTVKSEEEINQIKKACEITSKAFEKVLKFTKPNVWEYEVEAEIMHEFIRNGATDAYSSIVASGKSACILHYENNDKQCQDGDLVLLDFGAEYGNYASDLSRTIPANGKFTPRQRQCYEAVLRVFKKAKLLFVPGNTIDFVNSETNKYMEEELIGLGLFTIEDVAKQDPTRPIYQKYFMHGTTHFMGLDVHDVGTKQTPFVKGMVLTCEPGLYIKDENIGIRIENDIMVDDISVDLMVGIPFEADEIEKLMKN